LDDSDRGYWLVTAAPHFFRVRLAITKKLIKEIYVADIAQNMSEKSGKVFGHNWYFSNLFVAT
jgi:hypothetical protein